MASRRRRARRPTPALNRPRVIHGHHRPNGGCAWLAEDADDLMRKAAALRKQGHLIITLALYPNPRLIVQEATDK